MKIQIIGGSGTGKSTLAKFISEQENIPWIDTDRCLLTDDTFTENHPVEKRLELYLKDRQSADSYVVSGSVFSWCPEGFSDRDLFVFLTLDEAVRMKRLKKREKNRRNGKDMRLDEQGEPATDFIEWCKTYHTEKDPNAIGTFAAQVYEMKLSKNPVLKIDSSKPVEELYKEVSTFLRGNISP